MSPAPAATPVLTSKPAWVKDAVFYQIFPDRFARSEREQKPPNVLSWSSAPPSRVTMAATCEASPSSWTT